MMWDCFCQVSLLSWSRLMFQRHFLNILIIRHLFSFVDQKFNYFSIQSQYFQANRNWGFTGSECQSRWYIRNWIELKYSWSFFFFLNKFVYFKSQSNRNERIKSMFHLFVLRGHLHHLQWTINAFSLNATLHAYGTCTHTSDIAVPTFYFIFIRIDFDPLFSIVRLILGT